ncbi:molybdenum cofactor biosynthesis protein B [Demequina sp. NBRC 110057]|uniref:MogA/MoaB family molybdenum cofactor biosynthesis protein n=1 Tax=Demequina sp. NBRC 110057 TaxID=1570346 RepID=UPI000A0437F8|nr:MogA/MoaB family molybdenum cofactor biosynthesis protein [Demequina sp. NBRC 110057]
MPSDLSGVTAAVITVSDRRASGTAADSSGPTIAAALTEAGASVAVSIVPDGVESVRDAIVAARASGARVILTTGGTGVAPRDLTPEATAPLLERDLPGIPELLRREGAHATPMAAVSRGLAGITAAPQRAVIVNLPGSQGAARDGVAALLPLLGHLVAQVDGADH